MGELEVCRQKYNAAGRLVKEAQQALDDAFGVLIQAAEDYGKASASE